MSHLPFTCNFQLVEIDLREHLSEQTVSKFLPELARREVKRQKKKEEQAGTTLRDRPLSEAYNMPFVPRVSPSSFTHADFPTVSETTSISEEATPNATPASPSAAQDVKQPQQKQLSFAEAMKTADKRAHEAAWPVLATPPKQPIPQTVSPSQSPTQTHPNSGTKPPALSFAAALLQPKHTSNEQQSQKARTDSKTQNCKKKKKQKDMLYANVASRKY